MIKQAKIATLKGQHIAGKSLVKAVIVSICASLALSAQAQQEPEKVDDYLWLDNMHRSIADSVNVSAQWFDNFFAEDNMAEEQNAIGEARIRLGWEPRSRDLNEFEARLRVRVKLPKLKDRVDLILSDYEEDGIDDKITAGRQQDVNRQDRFSLALRFKPQRDSGFSHRIGFGRRFQVFAKSRYRTQFHFNEATDLRWEASVYYYNRDQFGADTRFTLDHQSDKHSIYRFSSGFFFRDKTNDWLWQHSWQYFKQRNDKTAVIYGLYLEGLSQPNYRTEEYLTSVRWRQNTLREWLFYEIEPFVLWRRDEGFSASYGIALRVEGFFGEY